MPEATKPEKSLPASAKLTRAAWRVIKLDKELLGLSAISAVCNLIVFIAFIVGSIILFPNMFGSSSDHAQNSTFDWAYYALLALYLLITYAVTNFFSGAIAHAAFRRFDGNDPTFSEALRAARAKAGPLLAFTLLQTTVGLILNILSDRVPGASKIAVWLVGAAWGVASMFAIPVIMIGDERNPLKVVKRSASTFTSIWKESVFIGLGLGAISIVTTILITFVVVALFGIAIALSSVTLAVLTVILLIALIIVTAMISSTLHAVLMTAAYYYATQGRLPAGFDEELVRAMFRPKKKWLN